MRHLKQSSEANTHCAQVSVPQHGAADRSNRTTSGPLHFHDKHLGRVSAALASCSVLGCWNGRRAGVLFMTVLFGKTRWKKCLCLCGLAPADLIKKIKNKKRRGHKSNTNEPQGLRLRSTKLCISSVHVKVF